MIKNLDHLTKSFKFRTMILSFGWAIAFVCGTWKFQTPVGCFAAGVGAAAGVVFSGFLARRNFATKNHVVLRMHGDLLFSLLTGCGAWLCGWIFDYFYFFSIPIHLLLRESLTAALIALSSVGFLRSMANRFLFVGIFEAVVAICLSANLFSGHRQTLSHPFWLVDLFMRQGVDPLIAIKSIGIAVCLLLACMLSMYCSTSCLFARRR
jgi:hypothetical protein